MDISVTRRRAYARVRAIQLAGGMARKGKNRHFAVEFVGSGDVHLVDYAWQSDGKKQATGSRVDLRGPCLGKPHQGASSVVRRDGHGGISDGSSFVQPWPGDCQVHADRHAHRGREGALQRFTVEATDADEGDPLAYRWLLDGRPLAKGTALRWTRAPRGTAG